MTIRELITALLEANDIDLPAVIGTADGCYYEIEVSTDAAGALIELGEEKG